MRLIDNVTPSVIFAIELKFHRNVSIKRYRLVYVAERKEFNTVCYLCFLVKWYMYTHSDIWLPNFIHFIFGKKRDVCAKFEEKPEGVFWYLTLAKMSRKHNVITLQPTLHEEPRSGLAATSADFKLLINNRGDRNHMAGLLTRCSLASAQHVWWTN